MSLHLLFASSDVIPVGPNPDPPHEPGTWEAEYRVGTQARRGEDPPGPCYCFVVKVRRDREGYAARAAIEGPARPSMREALLKLAEWAAQVAEGIAECEPLPEQGFPAVVPRNPLRPPGGGSGGAG